MSDNDRSDGKRTWKAGSASQAVWDIRPNCIQSDGDPVVRLSAPTDLSNAELAEFQAFVAEGGEVDKHTLRDLVARAVMLGRVFHGELLIATAALKRPNRSYWDNTFHKAGTPDLKAAYPVELGWVRVAPEHTRQNHARNLLQVLLSNYEATGVFATTKNVAMLRLLPSIGFVACGHSYPSGLDPTQSLTLYIKP